MTGRLLRNSMITPDGTHLISRDRHDYKSHVDTVSGETYMVDGGNDYIRRTVNKVLAKDTSLYTTDPHSKLREELCWGTYGKHGDKPLEYIKIKDMNKLHIQAILDQGMGSDEFRTVLYNELEWRLHGGETEELK